MSTQERPETLPDEEINPSTTQIKALTALKAEVEKLQAEKAAQTHSETPIFDTLVAEYQKRDELEWFFPKVAAQ